jgi:hypothetical protein
VEQFYCWLVDSSVHDAILFSLPLFALTIFQHFPSKGEQHFWRFTDGKSERVHEMADETKWQRGDLVSEENPFIGESDAGYCSYSATYPQIY